MQLSSVFAGLVIALGATVYAAPTQAPTGGEVYTFSDVESKRRVSLAHPGSATCEYYLAYGHPPRRMLTPIMEF